MRNYTVLQDGIKECGSACLLSIIRYYGGNISIDKLVEMTKTTKEGTNFYNLSNTSYELGLNSCGYKVSNIDEISNYNFPLISQVIIDSLQHFVVIYKIRKDVITVMDPAKGMRKIKKTDFENIMTGYILTFSPYKKMPVYNQGNYIVSVLKDVIISNKSMIYNLIVMSIIITLLTCLYSYYVQIIIDKLFIYDHLKIIIISIMFMIILFIKSFLQYFRNIVLFKFNKKIDLSIIHTTIKKIIFLPYSYYKNKTTGEVISRVNDLFYIKNVVSNFLISFFLELSMSIISFIILLSINVNMTLLLLLIVTIYFILFLLFKPYVKDITDVIQEDNAKVNSLLIESINGFETVKGLNIEDNIFKKISKLYTKSINNNIMSLKIDNNKELLIDLFEGLIILIITYVGINFIMDKSLSVGALFTYETLIQYFLFPIRNILNSYRDYFYVGNSMKKINNIINIEDEIVNAKSRSIIGDIDVSGFSFSYNMRKKILDNFSLNIKYGEKVLILGKTGCGKSTLLKSIYGYLKIDNNAISLNGRDINEYSLSDIRHNMVMISQNEILFTSSIRDNILLGRSVTDMEFMNVVCMAHVSDFVEKIDIGYDFVLEENGANISGGQKQRIILARSLLKNANYYLVDEGLNQIDVDLERKILCNLFELKKTFIVISHRLENMDLYDKVIEMEDGKIINVCLNGNIRRKGV